MTTKVGSPKIIYVTKEKKPMLSFNVYQSEGLLGYTAKGWKMTEEGRLSAPLVQFRPGRYFSIIEISKAAALDIYYQAALQFKGEYPQFFPDIDANIIVQGVVYTSQSIAKALPESKKGTDAEV